MSRGIANANSFIVMIISGMDGCIARSVLSGRIRLRVESRFKLSRLIDFFNSRGDRRSPCNRKRFLGNPKERLELLGATK